jgi:putative transposase
VTRFEQCLKRVDLAFAGFFRRVRSGEKPGYPRFKSRRRYDSTTYRRRGWRLDGRRLSLSGIGTCKLFLSRSIEGTIKTVTLRRDRCGDWWVIFACEDVPARPLPDTGRAAGVDLGLESFLTTSDGESVSNPRYLRAADAHLKRMQRRVAKRKRGGSRRRKMVRTLARQHRRVESARRDFHFKTALELVRRYDHIAVEDLNVRGLSRSALARSVNDAGWAQFLGILAFKAEEAGRRISVVDCRGTSQVCSGCGCEPDERKSLAVRVHRCTHCGLVLHRDHNAAVNILTRARAEPSASRPAGKSGGVDLRTPEVAGASSPDAGTNASITEKP